MGELLFTDEDPTTVQFAGAIHRATIGLKFTPISLGSAIKNTCAAHIRRCMRIPTHTRQLSVPGNDAGGSDCLLRVGGREGQGSSACVGAQERDGGKLQTLPVMILVTHIASLQDIQEIGPARSALS